MNTIDDSTIINCSVCCKEIPLDVIFTPEGAEYVEHFCGLDCYARFQARAKAVAEHDTVPVLGGANLSD